MENGKKSLMIRYILFLISESASQIYSINPFQVMTPFLFRFYSIISIPFLFLFSIEGKIKKEQWTDWTNG